MCIDILQIYTMYCQPSILMITAIFQMKKKEMDKKYDPSNLFLRNRKYNEGYKKDEEKSKSRPEKLPILSVPIKARNNS